MFEKANQIIENRLSNNWTDTLIDFDNVKFDAVEGVPFIRLQIEWVDSALISIGHRIRAEGYIEVSIFTPFGEGSRRSNNFADAITELFSLYYEDEIKFDSAIVERVGQQKEWYHLKVIVPFKYDKCYVPGYGYTGYGT